MTTATYTLTSDGLVILNTQNVITEEWWERSPTQIRGIGFSYEARATVIENTGAILSGTFDEWLSLIDDRTWSADQPSNDATLTRIQIQIRNAANKEIEGSAIIRLENEEITFGPIWNGPTTTRQGDTPEPGVFTGFGRHIDLAKATKDRVIVGAPLSDINGTDSGQVHIYRLDAGNWVLEQTLTQPSPAASDQFGAWVNMNGDGSRVVVKLQANSPNNNSTFVYQRTGTTWSFVQNYVTTITGIPHGENWQQLNESGDLLFIVGTGQFRQLEIAEWNGSQFVFKQRLDYSGAPTNTWGETMRINRDGSVVIVSQRGIGIFTRIEDDGTGTYQFGPDTSGVGNSPLTSNYTAALAGTGLNSQGNWALNTTVLNSWYWDGAAYQQNSVNLTTLGDTISISQDGWRLPDVQTFDGGRTQFYEGDGLTPYTVSATVEPDNFQAGTSARSASMSYDGRLVAIGNDNWGTGNQGRFFTLEVGGTPAPAVGWNPAYQADNAGTGNISVTYSDNNKVATVTNYNSQSLLYLGGATARNSGQRYIEFKILTGDAGVPNFTIIETQLLQAGLMPSNTRVSDNLPPKAVGVRFENSGSPPTQGEFDRTYINQTTLPSATPKASFGAPGDVIAFAIDFATLDWFVYRNNVLVGNFEDFGLGDSFGSLEPSIHLPAPTLWSVRIQELAADQDFAPPAGFIPWGDP